jgi:hypothetical protein
VLGQETSKGSESFCVMPGVAVTGRQDTFAICVL